MVVVAALVAPHDEAARLAPSGLLFSSKHHHSQAPPSDLSFSGNSAGDESTADQARGGPAVAHYANGIMVKARGVQKKAPTAALYPTGTYAGEPTMGIDKDGTMFYVGVEPSDVHFEWPVLRSNDNGKTWKEISPMFGSQRQHAKVGLDPMLHVDTDTGRVFTVDLQLVECHTVSFSDDKGATWTTSEACGLADHQTVFTGPPTISTTVGYPNVVYDCAIDGGVSNFGTMTSCLKSLDGGITWARTGSPPYTNDPSQEGGQFGIPGYCGGATGHGVVDDEGTIYLPRGFCGQPYLAISKDEGLTWERVQVADNGMPYDEAAQLEEHEAGVAVDARGNTYYTWTGRDRLIYLVTSTDGGKTWSDPMMIGAPGTKETWGPTIAVGTPGRIAVAYIGSTNAPGGKSPQGSGEGYADVTWDGYITITKNALANKPLFYSGSINDPSDPLIIGSCDIIICQHETDFIDVVIGPDGTPWTSMVDGYSKDGKNVGSVGFGIVGGLIGGPSLKK